MKCPIRRLALCCAWLPLLAQDSKVRFESVPAAVIQQRLELAPEKLAERRAAMEDLFRESGCDGENLSRLKVPGSKEPDLICTLPGEDPQAGTIVVGGHYDHVPPGRGVVDDWSGAALLPSLYLSLHGGRRHRYVFIAFSGEERGLLGSEEYVHRLSKAERAGIRAMINLECLGMTAPVVWGSRADPRLLRAYALVAHGLGLVTGSINVNRVGDDDSHPFLNARVPVLTIHSVSTENFAILHSARDQVRAIHPEHYYASYRLAATLLAYLDGDW